MGQNSSTVQDPKLKSALNKLSKVEIKDLEAVFLELSTKTQEGESVIKQPTWLNRSKFAEIFGTDELFVEQLFEVFDKDKNGVVDLEEFVSGMALVLHGSIKDKCILLFKIFNLDGDEGISREELRTVLTSILQSTRTVLLSTLKAEGFKEYDQTSTDQSENAMMVSVVVEKIVKDAFEKCDASKSQILELNEFLLWVNKNHKLVNNFILQCPKLSTTTSTEVADIDTSDTLTNATSLFSIIDTPVNNKEIHEIFEQENTPTLLKMASSIEKPSVQDLFSQTTESNDDPFFDCIASKTAEKNLPRSTSQVFSTQLTQPSIEFMGGSETNLNELTLNKRFNSKHIVPDQSTDSLQSITLSRDDLTLDSSNNSVQNNKQINGLDEISTLPCWHPLQGDHETANRSISLVDETEVSPSVVFTEKHSISNSGAKEDSFRKTTASKEASADNQPSSKINDQNQLLLFKESISDIDTQQRNLERQLSNQLVEQAIEEESKSKENPALHFWQPSNSTKQILDAIKNGKVVDPATLTFPSVLVEGVMGDPVKELVSKYLGEQEASKRPTYNLKNVDVNEKTLKQLLADGCWRGAVDWTTRYLTTYGQGMASVVTKERTLLTPILMQVWFVRIALLTKLRMFSSAEAELNAFNDFDAPDTYYEFYPDIYPGKTGSIIPFSFRLLHAELPQHNGRPNVALDRLYILLNKVNQVISNLSNGCNENGLKNDEPESLKDRLSIWQKRSLQIHYSLGNCFFGMKEYTLAVTLYEKIIELDPERKSSILSAIGRIYLQFGDVKTSEKYFKQVEDISGSTSVAVRMNRGFTFLVNDLYEEAHVEFLAVVTADPKNIAAYNNDAVCLLFLGKVKEASNLLESMVMRLPKSGLHEDVLFNLNTIYELETSRALQKKHKLLDMVNKYKGDGFNIQCLKLT